MPAASSRAFGSSVVAGNLIVGLVVFAVITLVQLIVVARGAERVAEVAARFALDAMPGKQMAIDAELRAGSIDARRGAGSPQRARARVAALRRDGRRDALRQGCDAIAAIVIVAVNLVGGLVVGIAMNGMTRRAPPLTRISLLSIGAGLVAQILSLLVAVASGLLVTRVASAGDRALGDDLGAQLASSPRVLGGVAIPLVGLAVVPGLPVGPFLVLGVIAAAVARSSRHSGPRVQRGWIRRWARRARRARRRDCARPAARAAADRAELHALLAAKPAELHAAIAAVRDEVGKRSGVPVPPFAITRGDASAPAARRPRRHSRSTARRRSRGSLPGRHPRRARAPKPPGALAHDRARADRSRSRRAARRARCRERARARTRGRAARRHAARARRGVAPVRARGGADRRSRRGPRGDRARTPEPTGGFAAQSVPALVEHLRGQLRRQISARWAPRGQLAVYTVDAMIEDAVRSSIERRDGSPALALEPAIAQDIVAAVRGGLGSGPGDLARRRDVRRHLRSLLEPELARRHDPRRARARARHGGARPAGSRR